MRGLLGAIVGVWLTCATAVAAPTAPEDLPTVRTYEVIGVASSDVLNVRAEPSSDAAQVGSIPHDARGIRLVRCISVADNRTGRQTWCEVDFGPTSGWTNARYLRAEAVVSAPAPSNRNNSTRPTSGDPETVARTDQDLPARKAPDDGMDFHTMVDRLLPDNFLVRAGVAAFGAALLTWLLSLVVGRLWSRDETTTRLGSNWNPLRSATWLLLQVFSFGTFFSVMMLLLVGQDFAPAVAYYVERYLRGIDDSPFEAAEIRSTALLPSVENSPLRYNDAIETGAPPYPTATTKTKSPQEG